MAEDLTVDEISYLQQVLTKRWHNDVPFRLDRISLGLVQRGLLELDVSHYLAKWYLTPVGEQALRARSPE
jgi:hypothetical protein